MWASLCPLTKRGSQYDIVENALSFIGLVSNLKSWISVIIYRFLELS